MDQSIYDVIIIGAGISGLAAADKLVKKNLRVKILEANSIYGGRIQKNQGFADFAIDTGADEIYNPESAYFKLASAQGAQIVTQKSLGQDYMEHPDKDELLSFDKYYDKFYKYDILYLAEQEMKKLNDQTTIKDYLNQKKIPEKYHRFQQNFLGNKYFAPITDLSIKGVMENIKLYENCKESLLKNMTQFDLLSNVFRNVLPLITYNSPVTVINYSQPNCNQITTADNQNHFCKYLLVTVPISQLRNNSIQFYPPLPQQKLDVISKIQMRNGGKLLMKFKERFWDDQINTLILSQLDISFIQNPYKLSPNSKSYVLIALISEEPAQKMNNETTKQQMIREMLGKLAVLMKNHRVPELLESYLWIDYSAIPYIQGCTSYPSVFQAKNSRTTLSEPVNNRVFFAGEATSVDHSATINGAYDTGIREAENILKFYN